MIPSTPRSTHRRQSKIRSNKVRFQPISTAAKENYNPMKLQNYRAVALCESFRCLVIIATLKLYE